MISASEVDTLLAQDHPEWFRHWLEWSFTKIPGVQAALLVADIRASGSFAPAGMMPLETHWESRLLDIAEKTLGQRKPLLKSLETDGYFAGSWPVEVGDRLCAVVSLVIRAADEETLHEALASVEWCAGWVELYFARELLGGHSRKIQRQDLVLDGVAGVLDADSFEHAALYYVNMLASRLHCDRVVLGYVKGGELEVHSQSHSSTYSERHALMQLTADAMQEAVDQRETVCWPTGEAESRVAVAHRDLNDSLGSRALLSVPLVDKAECYGAVLFERHQEAPFTEDDIVVAEALANVVGNALEEKRQAELPLYRHVLRAMELQLERLVGPGFLWRKVALGVVVLLTLFFLFAKGQYNLSADAVLEGGELRAIVAPFDSYIEKAHVRAGDQVEKGDELAALDTRELRLQRMSWISQMAQSQRQYEEALAKQERAQVQISTAEVKRAQAELQLVEYQIEQAQLVAPFDGLVVTGDLSQRVGTVVGQGDVLFELAPSNRFRLALYVDEFRIRDVETGQEGRLVLSALSDQEFHFTVTRINPMAEVRDGNTVYRVEAELEAGQDMLRAGLEGVARIAIDRRHLIAIWTRSLRDKLSLEWWRFWG